MNEAGDMKEWKANKANDSQLSTSLSPEQLQMSTLILEPYSMALSWGCGMKSGKLHNCNRRPYSSRATYVLDNDSRAIKIPICNSMHGDLQLFAAKHESALI